MAKNPVVLKGLLGVVGVSHIGLGVLALSGKKGLEIGGAIYGTRIEFGDQLNYLVRLVAAYLISMGLLHLKAASDPASNKTIIDVTLLIYLLNAAHRVANRKDAYTAFGVTEAQIWGRVAFFTAMGMIMLGERLKLEQAEPAPAQD